MNYCVVIEYINGTARLNCESMAEAQLVGQSFVNYGLDIVNVTIENNNSVAKTQHQFG